jgi:hypothetical protein
MVEPGLDHRLAEDELGASDCRDFAGPLAIEPRSQGHNERHALPLERLGYLHVPKTQAVGVHGVTATQTAFTIACHYDRARP